ncbi:hypothetical protein OG21DRAFT_1518553 [Imleria badia]|nr:hypothetical protein OG21DRAFT_1518553 [Imleria badia]
MFLYALCRCFVASLGCPTCGFGFPTGSDSSKYRGFLIPTLLQLESEPPPPSEPFLFWEWSCVADILSVRLILFVGEVELCEVACSNRPRVD